MRTVFTTLVVLAMVACSPPSFERFFASGERYLAEKRYAEAAIEFENAARVNPQSAAAQLKLGDVYAELNQLTFAAAAYERACALDEQDAATCLRSASQLLSFGEDDRAAAQARIVLSSNPSNLDGQLILAMALGGARRFGEAEELCRPRRRPRHGTRVPSRRSETFRGSAAGCGTRDHSSAPSTWSPLPARA